MAKLNRTLSGKVVSDKMEKRSPFGRTQGQASSLRKIMVRSKNIVHDGDNKFRPGRYGVIENAVLIPRQKRGE
jgi:ribosomal protein S17